jgi:hypothetical protein
MNAQLIQTLVDFPDDKPFVRITSWHMMGCSLYGVALDHPRLGCQSIKSSTIVAFDPDLGMVETLNTLYVLDLTNPRFKPRIVESIVPLPTRTDPVLLLTDQRKGLPEAVA